MENGTGNSEGDPVMAALLLWFKGLLLKRSGHLLGAVIGVSLTVSLIASLGSFIVSSDAVMTQKAIQNVPVDWQIQLSGKSAIKKAEAAVKKTTGYTALSPVGYADVKGFVATTGGSTQTTGSGKVLGIDPSYRHQFPRQIRQLLGKKNGVLIAQQTAANLHISLGDTVTIQRVGLKPVKVKVNGIVSLPNSDAMFQKVGSPKGSKLQAPPDNVMLLPSKLWHSYFDHQAKKNSGSAYTQLHVKLNPHLSGNPNTAYQQVTHLANNVEAKISGGGMIGNNLAARLDGVRGDALYAHVLFLFLGLPGAFLAVLLTIAVVNTGRSRHRKEQSLLKTRGASSRHILILQMAEAVIIGIGGTILGLIITYFVNQWMSSDQLGTGNSVVTWMIIASLSGIILSLFAVLFPAWREGRQLTAVKGQKAVGRVLTPLWQRFFLDFIFLLIAGIFYWRSASTGYQLVMAPEGVPQTSVDYTAFIAPFFLWIGGALLFMRCFHIFLGKGKKAISRLLSPISRKLAPVVSSSFSRQRLLIVRGIILTGLAISFAISTSVFNLTYNVQSRVDAQLTNGADVNVTGSTYTAPSQKLKALKSLPGVSAIQPLQHRYAYVGNDLQDMYGIQPQKIGNVTTISNAYFKNGNAQQTLQKLSQTPNGVLVSEETVKDYQLHKGDLIKLRLQSAKDHQYHIVPFHFIGVIKEFPTAPKDSFLVANQSYLSKVTGTSAKETILIKTSTPAKVASEVKKITASMSGITITNIHSTKSLISSGLTALNLHGLTRLELLYAILFVAGTAGLILALGLNERRRTFAILTALGAKRKQLGAFIWSEGFMVLIPGLFTGGILGFSLSFMLVKMLKGVFDPPPESFFVPWGYLILLIIFGVISTVVAVVNLIIISRKHVTQDLRNL